MHKFADEPVLIEMVGSQSDAWLTSVIAGGFVIIGALLGFFSNVFAERMKQKRAAATRWDTDIRLMGAEVFTAAESLLKARKQQAAKSGYSMSTSAINQQCEEYASTIVKLSSNLYLITPDYLSTKIQTLSLAILLCEQNGTTAQNFPLTELTEAKKAMRVHFGVTS